GGGAGGEGRVAARRGFHPQPSPIEGEGVQFFDRSLAVREFCRYQCPRGERGAGKTKGAHGERGGTRLSRPGGAAESRSAAAPRRTVSCALYLISPLSAAGEGLGVRGPLAQLTVQ